MKFPQEQGAQHVQMNYQTSRLAPVTTWKANLCIDYYLNKNEKSIVAVSRRI